MLSPSKNTGTAMKKKKKREGYHYCEIHKQQYMDFLHQCPICRGEIMGARIKAGLPYMQIKSIKQKKVS